MSSPKSFKTVEIMQQCKFGFNKQFIDKLLEDWSSVNNYAYILHDKDDTEPHIHLMIRFYDSVPTTAILKKLQGVCEVQHLNKMKKWTSAIAYLTHANRPEKYQYEDSEVVSNYEWKKDKEKGLTNTRLDEIISGIDNGIIREYNYFEHISMKEYARHKKQIQDAFKYRLDRLEGANREMECIFITGESGSGKTTYAKILCEEKGYSYVVSSGSNDVLDNYKGQDAIILDDLRPSCMGLSDLLKMLDNNTASSVKSRYKNKVLECKLIVITTTLNIETFFNNVFESENESRIQLMRRCKTYLKMDRETMEIQVYNAKKRLYESVMCVKNPVEFVKQETTVEEMISFVQDMLGDTIKGLENVKVKASEFIDVDQEELPFN